ncbi:MAG: hypothetical protein JSS49_07965 [Planctomycetes bacterium]|nr:hypothetical protein [Planctomycetota bacterium]
MIDFKQLGQPSERQLASLPIWAREWIETLKYRVLYWHSRAEGREPVRSRVNAAEPEAMALFGLPWWAQDWVDQLHAEAVDQRGRAMSGGSARTSEEW